jgi:hypothetical protein
LKEIPANWQRYERASRGAMLYERDADLIAVCERLDPDAVVASSIPWQVLYWCGNAGVRIPIDPVSDEVRDRFVAELRVAYILVTNPEVRAKFGFARWLRSLENSDGYALLVESGPLVLYEVTGAPPETRPWKAPPPLVCAGLGSDCTRRTAPRR